MGFAQESPPWKRASCRASGGAWSGRCHSLTGRLELAQGQRVAVQEALEGMAAEKGEQGPLLFSFHSLGNDRKSHGLAEGNDGLSDSAVHGVRQNPAHKRSVNLQL